MNDKTKLKIKRTRKKYVTTLFAFGPWALAFFVNLIFAAFLFAQFEGISRWLAMYWAVVSGTTTGFGDVLPHEQKGYIVTIYLLLSSWLIDKIAAAVLTKNVIEDPHLHSDTEQKYEQAAEAYQIKLSEIAVMGMTIDPKRIPEQVIYYRALEALQKEKRENAS